MMKTDSIADGIALEAARDIAEITCVGLIKSAAVAGQVKAKIKVRVAEAIEEATKKQARAGILGMDAAKHVGRYMEQNALKLYSQCGPEALSAERTTNERLTELVLRLEERLEAVEYEKALVTHMLREISEQHRCECEHPFCNRCNDYRRAKAVLERAGF